MPAPFEGTPTPESTHTGAPSLRFQVLQLLRASFLVAITVFVGSITDLGTPLPLLCGAAVAGTYLGGSLLLRKERLTTIVWQHIAFFALAKLLFIAGEWVGGHFVAYRFWNHFALTFSIYALALALTCTFWVSRQVDTWEATAVGGAALWLLSGHRNYHLDSPKTVSELAFTLGVEPHILILGAGLLLSGVIVGYFLLASSRPLFRGEQPVLTFGVTRWRQASLIGAVLLLLLGNYVTYVHRLFTANLSRASEGVGQGGKEGESPLGFHSAVGKTKQPAALVRLEGDYEKNPWKPMLYLREGALSEYNGKELVLASRAFDTDVPRAAIGDSYVSPFLDSSSNTAAEREKLLQSIYLLTKHEAPFGVDRIEKLYPIQNPDPERFIGAFQALSYAPTVKLDEIYGEEVGDPKWSIVARAHYLRAPGSESSDEASSLDAPHLDKNREDLRYKRLSRELTTSFEEPVAKAAAIVAYLSKESIYTRSPGHQASEQGDPVAPYLFAPQKKGYCVHFAHAAVYMLRLAGVPARIATGYLTDLSYAKDGHILLHLGDRHAWPEIYVRDRGWVVVDVTPAQAENEQAIIPDEKLLDELMSKLDPAKELVTPPPTAKEDRPAPESLTERIFRRQNVIGAIMVVLLLFIGGKLFLRFGYLLVSDPRRKLLLAYTAAECRLLDLGRPRHFGETRQEYARRLLLGGQGDLLALTTLNERRLYSPHPLDLSGDQILGALEQAASSLSRTASPARRALAFFNPFSLFLLRWR